MRTKSHNEHRNAFVFSCRERIYSGVGGEGTEESIAGTNSQPNKAERRKGMLQPGRGWLYNCTAVELDGFLV